MEVTKAAVETCVWPLYEVVEGKYILSYQPKNKLPVEEYLKLQGRFAHMFKPGTIRACAACGFLMKEFNQEPALLFLNLDTSR